MQLNPMLLERAGQRENVADVVVDDHDLAPDEQRIAAPELLQRRLGNERQSLERPVQDKGDVVLELSWARHDPGALRAPAELVKLLALVFVRLSRHEDDERLVGVAQR